MANLLFGSSNVYRHYKNCVDRGLFSAPPLQLVNCTKKTVFDSHLSSLSTLDLVVSSVLENFVVDACEGVPDIEVPHFANQQITAHVETIIAASLRFPTANFIIVPPVYRNKPSWFGPHLPGMLNHLASEVSRAGSARIASTVPFVAIPSMLEADGVHLTGEAGNQFLSHLDSCISSLLVAVNPAPSPVTRPDDRLDQILAMVTSNTSKIDQVASLSQDVASVTSSTSTFETYVLVRHQNDDFIFARMKEESDAETNRSREDRVCITGLPPPPSGALSHKDKKAHYTDVITRLVAISCSALPDLPVVVDVYVNLRKTIGQHLVEALAWNGV